ncbi:mechanosensitive ion channel [Candidatus Woesearchaeota archaeon]|nr:mechanosensitive ion channel [Candidatus Woesearchaeota archaeon]
MAGFIENNITNAENILTTTDRTAYLYSKIQPIFKDVVVAIIILLIGLIIGKLLGRVIQKILTSFELDKLVRKATGLKISTEEFLGKITSYSVFIIAVIIALDVLNLTSIIVYIISIILIAIIVFSIFVSIKDFFPNIIMGIYIHRTSPFKEGDHIKIDNIEGTVAQINLTEIKLETKSGDIIYIPNSLLMKKEIVKKR